MADRRSFLRGLAALPLAAVTDDMAASSTARDTPATGADYAALEFEPWKDRPGMWKPPTDEQWAYMGEERGRSLSPVSTQAF